MFAANAIRVLMTETGVRAAYGRLGGEQVLSERQRADFAVLGLRSVDPLRSGGVGLLRTARLPDGSRAFGAREIRHMRDVRAWLLRLLVLQAAAVVAIAGIAAAWGRGALAWTLRAGAVWTLVVGALALVAMAAGFHTFLLGFHKLLFSGDSWHFADGDTLIRVYPESFWRWIGIAIGLVTVLQAVAAFAAGQALRGRSRTATA